MELTPRKKAILAEIVRAHIESGEPIGSKILALRLPNAPSTATLRNEMSDLCEMGYLEQPHTSAGRVPTSKAYRLYVSELMTKEEMTEEGKTVVDNMLKGAALDPENIGATAAEILSKLTGLPVLVASNGERKVKIKKVSLLPMGRNSAVLFLVTDDGRAKSRLVCLPTEITEELVAAFEKTVHESICGRSAEELDPAYMQKVTLSAGLYALGIAPLISCIFELAGQLSESRVKVVGTANLFSVFKKETTADRMLEVLSADDIVRNIFRAVREPVEVVFGDDTDYSELKSAGMIVASYGDEQNYGKIAVIGPKGMSYGKLMPSVRYLADRVGNIMNDVLKGLEE